MDKEQFQMIMKRFDNIERALDLHNNPSAYLSVQEKIEVIKKAKRTGDKKKVKEALKIINGR